jgi:antitoxin FitA
MLCMAMPKAIQIRGVPDDVHAVLRVRAAKAGMSMSEYLRGELIELTAKPTMDELVARVQSRHGGASREAIVDVIREMRGPLPGA